MGAYIVEIRDNVLYLSGQFKEVQYENVMRILYKYFDMDLNIYTVDLSGTSYMNSLIVAILLKTFVRYDKIIHLVINSNLRWQSVGLSTARHIGNNIIIINTLGKELEGYHD